MMGQYLQESKILDASFDCYCINLATAESLSDIGHFSIKKIFKFLLLLKHIIQAVQHIHPQLVYITPNAGSKAFFKDFIVIQILKCMKCKVIAHYHNKGVSLYQDKWIYHLLYKRFFKDLKVILLAEALYKDMAKYVMRENVFICPNGIPKSLNGPIEAERHNEIPHLLFLSNLLISKGVFVLLDALTILKSRGYTFICQFVGGETAEINAEQFAQETQKRGISDMAIYVGRKVGKEKNVFFKQSDIFILPTKNECFPLVLLEAMEYKLPVISTDEGGIPDIVKDGENGLICEKQNPASLANCMVELIENKELRIKMGEAGYNKFQNEFTIQQFEQRMTNILSQNIIKP